MARPLRITLFFTDEETGWSESHYDLQAVSLTEGVERARDNLVPARRGLLAAGPYLQYIRASYDDTFRDSQVTFLPVPPLGAGGQYINNSTWKSTPAAVEWTAALLRGVGGDLYRKQIYISGLPYSDPTDVNPPQTDPAVVAAFQNYRRVLINYNYGFPVWQRDAATYPIKTVGAIAPAPLPRGGFDFTIPNHAFPGGPGTRVFVSGTGFLFPLPVRPAQSPNGAYVYTVVDNNTINVPAFRFPAGGTFVRASAQSQTKGVIKYEDVLLERFTHRKRGRPFDSPRGRSRRRPLTLVHVA